MGAVIFPAIPTTGSVDGKLDIHVEKFLTLDELLTHLPTAKAFFDELSKKGWRYYFIEGYGRAVMQLEMVSSPYAVKVTEHPSGGLNFSMSVEFGRSTPRLKLGSIVDLQRFVVNICGKHYPRGVTIDLAKDEVTYVQESLLVSKGEKIKEDARDILEILKWLIKEKKFNLGVGETEKHRELLTLLGAE